MELRRDSIERGDFPRVSDGFDPDSVATHLREVADAVEELRRSSSVGAPATSNAERVRAVVDSAERSLAELAEAARADAEKIRAEARDYRDRARRAAVAVEERAAALARELDELPDAGSSDEHEAPADVAGESTEASAGAAAPEGEPEAAGGEASGSPAGEAPRLIALNMALHGSSRDEIARYLSENFDLEDPGEIVDEVWTRARG